MPIYEFVCQSCGHEFEQIQSFSDVNAPACTNCESSNVVRRLGRPAIHFKGSGWYVTDSKKSKEKNTNSASGSADNGNGGSGGDKAEAKSTETKATDSATTSTKESTTPVAAD